MHLDERLEKSREAIGKQLAVGQKKVSSAFNNLWAEMEAMREAQRKRQEEQRLAKASEPSSPTGEKHGGALGGRCKVVQLRICNGANNDQGNLRLLIFPMRKPIFKRRPIVPGRTYLRGAPGQAKRRRGGRHRVVLRRHP